MEFNINEISTSEKEIEITYSFDEIKSELDKEILASTKKIQLPGFRKGKAPVSMIKKRRDSQKYYFLAGRKNSPGPMAKSG